MWRRRRSWSQRAIRVVPPVDSVSREFRIAIPRGVYLRRYEVEFAGFWTPLADAMVVSTWNRLVTAINVEAGTRTRWSERELHGTR